MNATCFQARRSFKFYRRYRKTSEVIKHLASELVNSHALMITSLSLTHKHTNTQTHKRTSSFYNTELYNIPENQQDQITWSNKLTATEMKGRSKKWSRNSDTFLPQTFFIFQWTDTRKWSWWNETIRKIHRGGNWKESKLSESFALINNFYQQWMTERWIEPSDKRHLTGELSSTEQFSVFQLILLVFLQLHCLVQSCDLCSSSQLHFKYTYFSPPRIKIWSD